MRAQALIISVVLLTALVGSAAAQNTIQWRTDPTAAVNEATTTGKPLMAWIGGSEREDESRLDRDQKRAFREPKVYRWSQSFVPLKLSRAQHRQVLSQFGFSEVASLEMRFLTPDGKELGSLGATGIAQPESLVQKMKLVLETYGRQVFDSALKPKLTDEKAKPEDIRQALNVVGNLQIRSADGTLVALLDRPRLDPAIRKQALETLAALGTKPALDELLEAARGGDAVAAKALEQITPAAAELLLPELKADATPFDYLVYKTLTKVAKVPQPKPERYFENSVLKLKQDEVQRVTELVRKAAQQWKDQNE